jgi:D-beta-D-heptose 7-phosphate kinase/D-beta-D-heptose 1-phosphate adenosyltransferase
VKTTTSECLSREQAAAFVRRQREQGRTVVFTNGVFDLLHPGHARYLNEARRLGDVLIVGINSDRSVQANKGPSRPINTAEDRAEVLRALAVVDAVVIFDEDTPLEIIASLEPDVLVKGADWGPHAIVGRAEVEARGGRVVRLDLLEGFSTTDLIDKAGRV